MDVAYRLRSCEGPSVSDTSKIFPAGPALALRFQDDEG